MRDRSDAEWDRLARDLVTRVKAFAPDWTEPSGGDPGMTLVDLFAFLGDSLLGRDDLPPQARRRLETVIARLGRVDREESR